VTQEGDGRVPGIIGRESSRALERVTLSHFGVAVYKHDLVSFGSSQSLPSFCVNIVKVSEVSFACSTARLHFIHEGSYFLQVGCILSKILPIRSWIG
jgi:hypothetical protein